MKVERGAYTDVDRFERPAEIVGNLDQQAGDCVIRASRQRGAELLKIKPGFRILDAGCGLGELACELAKLVGKSGLVVGVDKSQTMIEQARERAAGSGLPVKFQLADAHQLPFADNSFDGCRAERLLMHVADPKRVLSEMARVTRPGGSVLAGEPDWETATLNSPDKALTRRILNLVCDQISNGWIGRQLVPLFNQLGLSNVIVSPATVVLTDYAKLEQFGYLRAIEAAVRAGVVSATEMTRWTSELRELSAHGQFFFSVTGFGVSANK